ERWSWGRCCHRGWTTSRSSWAESGPFGDQVGLDDPQVPLPDGVERRHQLQAAELLGAAPRAVLADQLPAGPLEQVAVVVDPQPVLVVEPVVDQSPPAGPEGEEVELGDGGVDRGVVVGK